MAKFGTYPSGSVLGSFISITATSSGGAQTLHTAALEGRQRVRLDAWNNSTSDVVLTIQWAGTAAADEIKMTIPALGGPVSVSPDWTLLNGKAVKAYAGTTAVIGVKVELDDE